MFVNQTLELVDQIPEQLPADRRYVVAIAGPPASGKTTLAANLRKQLGSRAASFGLDAYHFDDAVLEARGQLDRKGSIPTFDANAYRRGLSALRDNPAETLSVPAFDRDLELTRNCAEIVTPDQQIIVTEGNYLLIRHEPWASLSDLFDLTVWIAEPVQVLRERLMTRWLAHGFTEAESQQRVEHNDLPNAAYTIENSIAAHHQIDPTQS